MGLFSRSDAKSSKAKIEELKRKIAEEGMQELREPAPAPAKPAVAEQPSASVAVQQVRPRQETFAEPPEQMEQFAQEQIRQEHVVEEPVQESIALEHHFQEKEVSHMDGVVLDIGNGMSLNLPIRSRMKLEEFLEIADKVKELKRINFS